MNLFRFLIVDGRRGFGGGWARVAALLACALAAGCMSSRVEVSKESRLRQRQWGMLCQDSAMLSALAYRNRRDGDAAARRAMEVQEPLRTYLARIEAEGWVHRGTCLRKEGVGQDLCFEVWENRRQQPRRIIFAFRGTQSPIDWLTNLRWVLRGRMAKDHYGIAPEECLPIIEELRRESPGNPPVITSTGHSLGGGLAQQLIYVAGGKVDYCIAFDSSPVTAFKSLHADLQEQYKALGNRELFAQYRIVRAYEKGEILSPVRDATQLFYKPDTLTRAVEFKSSKTKPGPIGKHDMNTLAQTILDHAQLKIEPADFVEYKEKRLDRPAYAATAPAFRPVEGGKARARE